MKISRRLRLVVCMCLTLAACTFGNGMICGPQTPRAYCDGATYERLAHPKPSLQQWEKPAMTSEGRRQDAYDCGGGRGKASPESACWATSRCPDLSDDVPVFGRNQIKAAQRPGNTENETHRLLIYDWQRCMLKKGYRYTGYCSVEYAKEAPACGAP
jgi:hypothetical protein